MSEGKTKFFDLVADLDGIIAGPPADAALHRFVELVTVSTLRHYAFEQLDRPDWIAPLVERGFFTNPPARVISPTKDGRHTIGFPFWSESRFLARMASRAPREVQQVLRRMPDTDNVRVHEDIAEAAAAMPAKLASPLAEFEAAWVARQATVSTNLPETLGELVSHLSRGGELESAKRLIRTLLEVLPDPDVANKGVSDEEFQLPPTPRARFDVWSYARIAQKNVPDLVSAAGLEALQLLCDLLEDAVRYSRKEWPAGDIEDFSYIWMPDIEHAQFEGAHGVREILIITAREAAEAILKAKAASLRECVRVLEQRGFTIFRRLALYLMADHPGESPDLLEWHLVNKQLFGDPACRAEYGRLAEKRFTELSTPGQAIILAWVEAGPGDEVLRRWYVRVHETEPSLEDLDRLLSVWQRDQLALLGDAMPQGYRARFERLVSRFGEPLRRAIETSIGWAEDERPPVNPSGMSVGQLVAAIKVYDAKADVPLHRSRPFAQALSALAAEPERFASDFEALRELDVRYMEGLFDGLRQAARTRQDIAWGAILSLAEWTVREAIQRAQAGQLRDQERTSVCRAVVQFVVEVLSPESISLPGDLRWALWRVIEPITHDQDPSLVSEARTSLDPATLSINTTRGEAMHAVVRYALWVRRRAEQVGDALPSFRDGLQEVAAVLDRHLDTAYEPAAAIRSVYGQWFPWLVLLDPEWAAARAARIFALDGSEQLLGKAAWSSYITFCQPYDSVFGAIAMVYQHAIDWIGSWEKGGLRLADPDQRLGEHIAALYWRGLIAETQSRGLLARFYERATPSLRAHVVAFIGRSLRHTSEVPADILNRLRSLWQARAAEAERLATSDGAEELVGFGWWIVAPQFTIDWKLTELKRVLQLTAGRIVPDHMVMESLVSMAEARPKDCVEVLRSILLGEPEWHQIGSRETRQIITAAMRSTEAREAADDLVQELAEKKGVFEFRDLISIPVVR